jgi:hypothetical protein
MLILMSRAIIDREVCLASSIDYFCTFGYVPLTGSTDINITEAKKMHNRNCATLIVQYKINKNNSKFSKFLLVYMYILTHL